MADQLHVSDYFKENNRRLSDREWERALLIRDRLNSFTDVYDQLEWIHNRRQSDANRNEDFRLFDISPQAEVGTNWHHAENEWHDEWRERRQQEEGPDFDPYARFDKNRYVRRDRHGNIKRDRHGNAKKMGPIGRASVNLKDVLKNSKVGKFIMFLMRHLHAVGLVALILFVVVSITILGFYVTGIISSLGHSPFVLCGQDEINGSSAVQITSADAEMAATPEYAANVFIVKARERGWKENAIVGALSYMLAEGLGMGTFTYEGFYCWAGPSKVTYDKTLSNEAWRTWMAGPGKEQAHNGYYASHNSDVYAAIGIGLLADSDVWNKDGTALTTQQATNLINFCDERNAPWQDPQVQMDWIFDVRFAYEYAFDTNDVDPTTSDLSPKEWCARILCGIGMPAWSWGYYDDHGNPVFNTNPHIETHTKHVPEAQALVDSAVDSGLILSFNQVENLCLGADSVITGGNATIADAAVTLAGGLIKIPFDQHGPDSPNLNKPELATYKEKHMEYMPGDKYFASCDRAACTAIRWSGADPDFPIGATGTQWNYLSTSEKWVYIGDYGKCDLMPGDVLITKGSGHIKIYVGNEAVKVRFPESDADMYAASYEQYFPRLYKDDPSYDSRVYAVFRNVKEVVVDDD